MGNKATHTKAITRHTDFKFLEYMCFSSTFRLKTLMKWLANAPFPDYDLLSILNNSGDRIQHGIIVS
jgi:hypothetical protein